MYTRSSFGSYYPINSIIHRLNPLIKIINFLIAVLLIIITNSVVVTYSLLLFIVIMMLLSKVPYKYYFDTFWHLRYIYLLIGVICYIFSVNALNTSVYIAKLVIIVEYLNIISYTTSPSENIWGIERLLSVFNYLYLPVSLLAAKIN